MSLNIERSRAKISYVVRRHMVVIAVMASQSFACSRCITSLQSSCPTKAPYLRRKQIRREYGDT
jgi:hypothetical protein